MVQVSALVFTLLAEGTAVLSIILIVWIVLTIRKKGKDKAAAKKLVKHIKKQANDRTEGIKSFLSSVGHEGEELLINAKKIDRLERDFFTQLVRLYIKRDAEVLESIDELFDRVLIGYKTAVPEQLGRSSETEEKDQAKIDSLTQEKEALILELQITKTTMGNMMKEFNTVFNGGNATNQTDKEALPSSMPNKAVFEDEDEINIVDGVSEPIDIDEIVAEIEAHDDADASAAKPISEIDDDFGSIVSSDDVDDLLDGIDLSKEIDEQ